MAVRTSQPAHTAITPYHLTAVAVLIAGILLAFWLNNGQNDSVKQSFLSSLLRHSPVRLAVISTYPPAACGIGQYTYNLVQAWREVGATVDVYAIARDPTEYTTMQAALNSPQSDMTGVYQIEQPIHLLNLIKQINARQYNATVLQYDFSMYPRLTQTAVHTLSYLHSPLFTYMHSPFQFSSGTEGQMLHLINDVSQQMFVMSNISMHHLQASFGLPMSNMAYTPHGAITRTQLGWLCSDTTRVQRCHTAFDSHVKEIDWLNRRVLLTFGLFHSHKGLSDLISAMPAIVAAVPNVLLIIVGQHNPSNQQNVIEYNNFKHAIQQNHLYTHVIMVDEYVSQDVLLNAITCADAVVTPYTDYTPVSGVLTQTIAMRVPVLTTPYNYADEWCGTNATYSAYARLACFNTPASLARSAVSLLSEPNLRQHTCESSHSAADKLLWSTVASQALLCMLNSTLCDRPNIQPNETLGNRHAHINQWRVTGFADEEYELQCERHSINYTLLSDLDTEINVQTAWHNGACRITHVVIHTATHDLPYAQSVSVNAGQLFIDYRNVSGSNHAMTVIPLLHNGALTHSSTASAHITHINHSVYHVAMEFDTNSQLLTKMDISLSDNNRAAIGYIGHTSRRRRSVHHASDGTKCAEAPMSRCQGCFNDKKLRRMSWTDFAIPSIYHINRDGMMLLDNNVMMNRSAPCKAVIGKRIKVQYAGPVWDDSGFAVANRENALLLLKQPSVDLTVLSRHEIIYDAAVSGRSTLLSDRMEPIRHWALKRKTRAGREGVEIRMEWPPQWTKSQYQHLVMYQPFEFGVVPSEWINHILSNVSEVWVPSEYSVAAYTAAGLPANKLHVITHGVHISHWYPRQPAYTGLTADCAAQPFRFLYRGGLLPRKGIDILLHAYINEFSASDGVCLLLHGSYGAFGQDKLQEMVQKWSDDRRAVDSTYKMPVIHYMIGMHMQQHELSSLHSACDAMVLPYRSEGYGLVTLEAAASLLPLIVTGAGPSVELLTSDQVYMINSTTGVCDVDPCGSMNVFGQPTAVQPTWIEPSVAHLQSLMRYVYDNPVERRARAYRAFRHVRQHHSWLNSIGGMMQRLEALTAHS